MLSGDVTTLSDARAGAILDFVGSMASAHARGDIGAHISSFATDVVWVTSHGVICRGREALAAHLHHIAADGPPPGSVRYSVEFIQDLAPDTQLVVVAQLYLPTGRQPQNGPVPASHIHSYVLAGIDDELRITAGQSTIRS